MWSRTHWWLMPAIAAVLLVVSASDSDIQSPNGPIIETANGSINERNKVITLQKGQNCILTCRGNGELMFMPAIYDPNSNVTSITTTETEDKNRVVLNLISVDYSAIGYYACFDNRINVPDCFFKMGEQYEVCKNKLINTEHVSYIYIKVYDRAPKPTITSTSENMFIGETFSVSCTVNYESTNQVELVWTSPISSSVVNHESYNNSLTDGKVVLNKTLTIINASKDDAGEYVCTSKSIINNESVSYKKVLAKPQIIIHYQGKLMKQNAIIREDNYNRGWYRKKIEVNTSICFPPYPPITETVLLKNKARVPSTHGKYMVYETDASKSHESKSHEDTKEYTIELRQLDETDSGIYTVLFKNQFVEEAISIDLKITGLPKVYLQSVEPKKYLINQPEQVECEVIGYPLPNVEWIFSINQKEEKLKDQVDKEEALYKKRSRVTLNPPLQSGNLTCKATNTIKGKNYTSEKTRQILVYEMSGGFGIRDTSGGWFIQGQNATLTCLVSKYDFSNVTWIRSNGFLTNVKYSENSLSYLAELLLEEVGIHDDGNYTCIGWNAKNTDSVNKTIEITVAEKRPVHIRDPDKQTMEVLQFQQINFTCVSDAVPKSGIDWYKDGLRIENTTNRIIVTRDLNQTTTYSEVKLLNTTEKDQGQYECRATSPGSTKSKFYSLSLKKTSTNEVYYISGIGVIFPFIVIVLIYLCWKICKEKRLRKELAAAGILYFEKGMPKSINPNLGITEQAELLPYDEKFEFPAEKLILGKQLGAGAFGVVYKAEARGILNAELTTTVAVKMLRTNANNVQIKSLASELKIMVHLGKHINIVNLLGACTKNVGKRELSVIVEYCRFGNIHRYLQQHRSVFVDTLNDNPVTAQGKVNKGYLNNSNSRINSGYSGSSTHTKNICPSFANPASTNGSDTKVSKTGTKQQEMDSSCENDYSVEGHSPRPLFSRDLLCWAFQIARGMEYLASRKVLHGDLAARNILLADDNVVKICDFGLAKSIYKYDEYQKKESSPLPMKWLAIECISDGIFSTQSDVWSFGILLWEMFTLAKTPYPNLSNNMVFPWLCDGNRLKKPEYADDKLYDVMMRCWEQKPTARPSFSQLQEIIGSFLEDSVRDRYLDLNVPYTEMNQRREGEDYLGMVCAPDCRYQVAPSGNHCDTQTFVLPMDSQLKQDVEGYLQMNLVTGHTTKQQQPSPRAENTKKLVYSERKLSSKVSDGAETPMLKINSLARNGSESDHKDSQNAPLYLNVCQRINEEAEHVFKLKKHNILNSQAKAVTNPLYALQLPDD